MKTIIRLTSVFVAAGFLLTACEGPMGPPGIDSTASCIECHSNDQDITAKSAQWAASTHVTTFMLLLQLITDQAASHAFERY